MFHVKADQKQKIFFYTPVSKFQKVLTLNICDGAKQIYPKKKKDSKERYSTNFSSSCPKVYSKKGVIKNSPPVYWHITKIHDITFKARDKTCSKIEKAWFPLLQWVAKRSKVNRKMFILIYLSNN